MSASDIINAAKFAWDVLKDGAPSSDIQSSTANAVPHVDDWTALTGAQPWTWATIPYSRSFVWPLDDYDHVQFEIKLKGDYGARYRGGGAYLPNVYVEVPHCFVGFGWSANIRFTAHNPTNAGTETAPLAALPVTIAGTVSSGAENHHVEWGFTIYGNGNVVQG